MYYHYIVIQHNLAVNRSIIPEAFLIPLLDEHFENELQTEKIFAINIRIKSNTIKHINFSEMLTPETTHNLTLLNYYIYYRIKLLN